MQLALLCDIGSTFTKGRMVDLETGRIEALGQVLTTVADGVGHGLISLEQQLLRDMGAGDDDLVLRRASSSAAGGLRMVTIGLTEELTLEAARLAALGAGARVIGVFSYYLGRREIEEIASLNPDILLLAGGTDGGDREVVVHNAQRLAEGGWRGPIVYAGNRSAADQVGEQLISAGFELLVVGNVMPKLGALDVESARSAIRHLFYQRIVHAKGFDRAAAWADGVVMPTPSAVQEAVAHAARLMDLDQLMAFDVGGATTDVYSVGGEQTGEGVYRIGLAAPHLMRTVEADLGLRVSLPALVEAVGSELMAVQGISAEQADDLIGEVRDERGYRDTHPLDHAIASLCVGEAAARHVGRVEKMHTPHGELIMQKGKDLTSCAYAIGVGGALSRAADADRILQAACWSPRHPQSLLPQSLIALRDRDYSLYAAGLLAADYPQAAERLLRTTLRL